MVRFEKLSAELVYPYEDAVAAAEYKNGTFGAVEDGKFTAGTGMKCIMQVEKGHETKYDTWTVKKDEHVRVADLTKEAGQVVNVTKDMFDGVVAENNVLVANADGMLEVGAGTTGLKVVEVCPWGVRATVIVGA